MLDIKYFNKKKYGKTNIKNTLEVVFVVVIIFSRIISPFSANLSYVLLAIYSFFGRAQAIRALALLWCITMLSPGIAMAATAESVGKYVVLSAVVSSVFFRSKLIIEHSPVKPMALATLLLGIFLVFHSLLFSHFVDVSVLKALSWAMTMVAVLSAWNNMGEDELDLLSRQIFGGLTLVMLVSLPLLGAPLGYLRNDTGFQGILNHPQAFGPTMALLGAWASIRMLGQVKPPWSIIGLVGACLMLIIKSEARTAGLALLLGIVFSVVFVSRLTKSGSRSVFPGLRSGRVQFLIGVGLLVVVIAGPLLSELIAGYIFKRGFANSLAEAYDVSRGPLIRQMWDNFLDKPLQGLGFGIASNPISMNIQRDLFFGFPTGATVEKGVLPLAILEEVGLIGFTMVTVWIGILLRSCASGGPAPFAVALTAVFLNLGESTLFSPGGMGLLSLILIGWAYSTGNHRERRQ